MLSKADEFISKNKADNTYKPLFHLAAPIGWINDPNGLIYYKGNWHIFYQYNPYAPRWDKMHWGHAFSADLIKFKHLPVALSPDTKNDSFLGCFSGSAMEKDGKLFLMYTGVTYTKQHQLLAESVDGVTFNKRYSPVIPIKSRPPGSRRRSFRDPKVIKANDGYYSVIGASYSKGKQIALYKSFDLKNWEYRGSLIKDNTPMKGIFECPDLVLSDGGDILIYSIMYAPAFKKEYQNLHSSVYMIGRTELVNAQFTPHGLPKELDYGADFYAPQTALSGDGRRILIAWMNMCSRTNPTAFLKHGWAGMLTLPRELEVINGVLFQQPMREVFDYFDTDKSVIETDIKESVSYQEMEGECYIMSLRFDYGSDIEIRLREGEGCFTSIKYEEGLITFNREHSGHQIRGHRLDGNPNIRYMVTEKSEVADLQIFADKSSIEIFMNSKHCMSNTIYPYNNSRGITFSSSKGIRARISFSPYKHI